VRIETCRESAVVQCPPMHNHRREHAAVYHTQHLYILGGFNGRVLSECERYVVQRTDGKLCLLSLKLASTRPVCRREQPLCTRGVLWNTLRLGAGVELG
jgi:hypothetical protein